MLVLDFPNKVENTFDGDLLRGANFGGGGLGGGVLRAWDSNGLFEKAGELFRDR